MFKNCSRLPSTSNVFLRRRERGVRKIGRADKRFDEIVNKEIKSKIAEAFLDLEGNIRISDSGTEKEIPEVCMELIKKKGESMKAELNHFIDSQIERITYGLSNR